MVDHVTTTKPEHKDCWQTPKKIYLPLREIFQFRADMAASDTNHLEPLYFTEENSALKQRWPEGWKWCNPPYSKPLPWVKKAAYYRETVMLVHLAVSSEWAKLAKRRANIIIQLQERIRFVHAETQEPGDSNMRDSQLIIFGSKPPGPGGARVYQLSFGEAIKMLASLGDL